MPTKVKAESAESVYLERVMDKYHKRLREAGVKVGLQFAHKGDDDTGPTAIVLHGYYKQATVRITSAEERRWGMPDAVVTYDRGCWERQNQKEKVALLDHELTHLELSKDKQGNLKSDDMGRPRLKSRPHDYEIGGFDEVISRHGVDYAPEARVVRSYAGAYQQLTLAFSAGPLAADEDEEGAGTEAA